MSYIWIIFKTLFAIVTCIAMFEILFILQAIIIDYLESIELNNVYYQIVVFISTITLVIGATRSYLLFLFNTSEN